jgi:tetratricopeptide (TPR) repeat protein
VASLESLSPAARRLEVLAPLLRDPVRAVRIETARALAAVPATEWPPEERQAFAVALAEFRAAQMATADMPSAHFQLGVVAAALGQGEEAEREYRKAIEMDPWFLPARMNLAVLYNQMGRNVDAERALGEAIQRFPAAAEPQYSLALLLAEENRLPEAVHFLKQAAEREPGRPRIRYNLALALARLGRPAEAETELLKAHEADREDPDYLHALATFYVRHGRLREALAYAEQLAALLPNTPGPVELVRQIRSAMSMKGAEPPPAPARQPR